jgi:nucleoside-diphosphate-sugar epimerase
VEKPFALTSRDAIRLSDAAAAARLPLAVNHNNVHHPAFARLLQALAAPGMGALEHVSIACNVPLAQLESLEFTHWMFASPRNIVFEQAVHPLSQLHALLGAVERVDGSVLQTRELNPGQTFCSRFAAAATAARGTADLWFGFDSGHPRMTIDVIAAGGRVTADLLHNTVSVERQGPWLDPLDNAATLARRGAEAARDAVGNLAGYATALAGITGRRDPFFLGMSRSISSFYSSLAAGPGELDDARRTAREVTDWCQELASILPLSRVRWHGGARSMARTPARPGEVVVFGANGFIGREVTAAALERGLPVTALVRRVDRLRGAVGAAAASGELRVMRAALGDTAAIDDALRGADTVVHLATGNGATWEEVRETMVAGSVAVAEAALRHGVRRFIYVSSIAALDPAASAVDGAIEDSLTTDPNPEARDTYSRGKILTEHSLVALHRSKGLPLVIVRPGIVMGRGSSYQHAGLGEWVRGTQCLGWGRGEHPLPFVTAADVADGIVRIVAFEGTSLDGRAVNLCGRVPLSARQMVDALAAATGRELRFHARPLWRLHATELLKWLIKKSVGRPDVIFPTRGDLRARAQPVPFACATARHLLGWQPADAADVFLASVLPERTP